MFGYLPKEIKITLSSTVTPTIVMLLCIIDDKSCIMKKVGSEHL